MGAAGVYYTLVTSVLAIMLSKKKKAASKNWYVVLYIHHILYGTDIHQKYRTLPTH